MGVKDLWGILAPVKKAIPLPDLRGQTLAVDLSIWVVETQGVRKMQGVVVKPHIRNLFFRINHLLQLGINLVFVIEGEPPQLKWDTMAQRNQERFGGRGRGRGRGGRPVNAVGHRPKRTQFNAIMRECCQMLDVLGVPYVQAAGEAEAMCALLNHEGVVDACVTNDGDAFLYGARRVYRNFTMDVKDPHVESYTMADIENELGFYRQSLVGMALILGCDYLPRGIPGVGRESALKFFAYLGPQDILQRFDSWSTNQEEFAALERAALKKKLTHCVCCKHPGTQRQHERDGCTLCESVGQCNQSPADYECPCDWHVDQRHLADKIIEFNIQKKAIKTEGFPWPKVVKEFLLSRDMVPRRVLVWKRPQLVPFILYSERVLAWVRDYSREKVMPLITLWDMKCVLGVHGNGQSEDLLVPHSIVKGRVRQGVTCYEILWNTIGGDDCQEEHYTTIEEADMFSKCFPKIVEAFDLEKAAKPARKKGKTSAKPPGTDDKENEDINKISVGVDNLNIIPQTLGNNHQHIQAPDSGNMILKEKINPIIQPLKEQLPHRTRVGNPGSQDIKDLSEAVSNLSVSLNTHQPAVTEGEFVASSQEEEDGSEEVEHSDENEWDEEREEGDDFASMAQAIEGGYCFSSDEYGESEEEVDEGFDDEDDNVLKQNDIGSTEGNESCSDQDEKDHSVPLCQRLKLAQNTRTTRSAINFSVKKTQGLAEPTRKLNEDAIEKYKNISVIKKLSSIQQPNKDLESNKTESISVRHDDRKSSVASPTSVPGSVGPGPTGVPCHKNESKSKVTSAFCKGQTEDAVLEEFGNVKIDLDLDPGLVGECSVDEKKSINNNPPPNALPSKIIRRVEKDITKNEGHQKSPGRKPANISKKNDEQQRAESVLLSKTVPDKSDGNTAEISKEKKGKKAKSGKSKAQGKVKKKLWYRQSLDFSSEDDDSNIYDSQKPVRSSDSEVKVNDVKARIHSEKGSNSVFKNEPPVVRTNSEGALRRSSCKEDNDKSKEGNNFSLNLEKTIKNFKGKGLGSPNPETTAGSTSKAHRSNIEQETKNSVCLTSCDKEVKEFPVGQDTNVDKVRKIASNADGEPKPCKNGNQTLDLDNEETYLFLEESTADFNGCTSKYASGTSLSVGNRFQDTTVKYEQNAGALSTKYDQIQVSKRQNLLNNTRENLRPGKESIKLDCSESYQNIQHSMLQSFENTASVVAEEDDTYVILEESVEETYIDRTDQCDTVLVGTTVHSDHLTSSQGNLMDTDQTVLFPPIRDVCRAEKRSLYTQSEETFVLMEESSVEVSQAHNNVNRGISGGLPADVERLTKFHPANTANGVDETLVISSSQIITPLSTGRGEGEGNYEGKGCEDTTLRYTSMKEDKRHDGDKGDIINEEQTTMYAEDTAFEISSSLYDDEKLIMLLEGSIEETNANSDNRENHLQRTIPEKGMQNTNDMSKSAGVISGFESVTNVPFNETIISGSIPQREKQHSVKVSKSGKSTVKCESAPSIDFDESVISGNIAKKALDHSQHTSFESDYSIIKMIADTTFDETVISGNMIQKCKPANLNQNHAATKVPQTLSVNDSINAVCSSLLVSEVGDQSISVKNKHGGSLSKDKCLSTNDGSKPYFSHNVPRDSVPQLSSLALLNTAERKRLRNVSNNARVQDKHSAFSKTREYENSFLEMPTPVNIDTPDLGAKLENRTSHGRHDDGSTETPRSSLGKTLKRNYLSSGLKQQNKPSPISKKYSKDTGDDQSNKTGNRGSINQGRMGDFHIESSLLNFSNENMEESCGTESMEVTSDTIKAEKDSNILKKSALSETAEAYSSSSDENVCEAASPVPLAKRLMSRFTRNNSTGCTVLNQLSAPEKSHRQKYEK